MRYRPAESFERSESHQVGGQSCGICDTPLADGEAAIAP